MYISTKNRSKLDIYKIWNRIFIEYTDTTKYLEVWAPKSHQVLIASKLIVIKGKLGSKLLTRNPMPLPPKPLQQLAGKLRSQKKLRKRLCIENKRVKAKYDGFIEVQAFNTNAITAESSHNPLV